jgi:hypothetical protein
MLPILTRSSLLQNALWGWEGGETDTGNPYGTIMVDSMHHAELGMFVHIMVCVRCDLTTQQLEELDRRLQALRSADTLSGMRIPKGAYFKSGATLFAFEHRAVIQVIMIVLRGMITGAQLHSIRLFVSWYDDVVRATSFQPCNTNLVKAQTTR